MIQTHHVSITEAVHLFHRIGFKKAHKWNNERLILTLRQIPMYIPKKQAPDDPVMNLFHNQYNKGDIIKLIP